MKARYVFENHNFKRGLDPRKALRVGYWARAKVIKDELSNAYEEDYKGIIGDFPLAWVNTESGIESYVYMSHEYKIVYAEENIEDLWMEIDRTALEMGAKYLYDPESHTMYRIIPDTPLDEYPKEYII